MKKNEIDSWLKLFDSAYMFFELKPWKWVRDIDLFGIQSPIDKEIYYCSILGNDGIEYGISLFQGKKGLELFKIFSSAKPLSSMEKYFRKYNFYDMLFVEKKSLEDADKKLLKKLNLFNKYDIFPSFRSYEAGFVPWLLNKEEIELFLYTLNEAMDICLKYKDNMHLIQPKKGFYFVRALNFDGTTIKKNDLMEMPREREKEKEKIVFDEIKLHKIRKVSKISNLIWEADIFDYPEILYEKGEKPFFPLVFFLVQKENGFILNYALANKKKLEKEVIDSFLSTLINYGAKPEELHIKSKDYFKLFKAISDKLGIKLIFKKRLEQMEEIRRDFYKYIKKNLKLNLKILS